MITGAMAMPWMFSCRRFVAPTGYRTSGARRARGWPSRWRPGSTSALLGQRGPLEDHPQWALGANYRLHAEGQRELPRSGHGCPSKSVATSSPPSMTTRGATYSPDQEVPRDEAHAHAAVRRASWSRSMTQSTGVAEAWIDGCRTSTSRRSSVDPSRCHLRFARRGRCRATSSPTSVSSKASIDWSRSCTSSTSIRRRVLGRSRRRRCSDGDRMPAGCRLVAVQAAFVPTRHGIAVHLHRRAVLTATAGNRVPRRTVGGVDCGAVNVSVGRAGPSRTARVPGEDSTARGR